MLAKAGGEDSGAGGRICSYGAASTQSSGGGDSVAPGRQAREKRSSSRCMKPECRASHASSGWEKRSVHKGSIRSSHDGT